MQSSSRSFSAAAAFVGGRNGEENRLSTGPLSSRLPGHGCRLSTARPTVHCGRTITELRHPHTGLSPVWVTEAAVCWGLESVSPLRLFLVVCSHRLLCLDTLTTGSSGVSTFQPAAIQRESKLFSCSCIDAWSSLIKGQISLIKRPQTSEQQLSLKASVFVHRSGVALHPAVVMSDRNNLDCCIAAVVLSGGLVTHVATSASSLQSRPFRVTKRGERRPLWFSCTELRAAERSLSAALPHVSSRAVKNSRWCWARRTHAFYSLTSELLGLKVCHGFEAF